MRIMIYAKNMELTPSINAVIEQKMQTLAKLFNPGDKVVEARIEVGKPSLHHQKGFVYYAEINIKIGSKLLRATEKHIDLRTAVDFARDDIERQIKKFKSKIRDTGRKPKRV